MGADIAAALAAAHAGGVLHRDVKPANVFLTEDGGAKLGDFGVAAELAGRTHASTAVGTVSYMAPEQDDGRSTEKSDVYALGSVLFEAWTGARVPAFARKPPTWPPRTEDRELRVLIGAMLSGDEGARPTAVTAAATLSGEVRSAQARDGPSQPPTRLTAGTRSQFRLFAILGAGGMAVVLVVAVLAAGRGGGSAEAPPVAGAAPTAGAQPAAATVVPAAAVRPLDDGEMPDLLGVDRETAERLLDDLRLEHVVIEVSSDETAPGRVLDQFPAPGTAVGPGDVVTFVISRVAAEGSPAAEPIVRVYDSQPPMEIDPTHRFEAVIYTDKGTIRLELLPQDAPGYVNNFVFLARNRFYDDLTFHRVIPGFVAQGGDPTGTGAGGPGYNLVEETNSINFDAGVISMAKGATVSGSQFFITLDPAPHLNDGFAVFGRVIEGMDVLRALTARDPSQPNQPEPDRILRIEIIEDGAS